jgi:hypothetical protein
VSVTRLPWDARAAKSRQRRPPPRSRTLRGEPVSDRHGPSHSVLEGAPKPLVSTPLSFLRLRPGVHVSCRPGKTEAVPADTKPLPSVKSPSAEAAAILATSGAAPQNGVPHAAVQPPLVVAAAAVPAAAPAAAPEPSAAPTASADPADDRQQALPAAFAPAPPSPIAPAGQLGGLAPSQPAVRPTDDACAAVRSRAGVPFAGQSVGV